jgi:hypothetical protein
MHDATAPPPPLVNQQRGDESRTWVCCPHGLANARCCASCWQEAVTHAIKESVAEMRREVEETRAALREMMIDEAY